MTPILAITLTAAIAAPQPSAAPAPTPLLSQAVSLALASPAPAASQPGGDSLKNGAVAGAIAGGLAGGAVVGYLCYMFNDGDNRTRDCLMATGLWAGIGAAGGAAIGAGVDALFARAPGARPTDVPGGPSARVRLRF